MMVKYKDKKYNFDKMKKELSVIEVIEPDSPTIGTDNGATFSLLRKEDRLQVSTITVHFLSTRKMYIARMKSEIQNSGYGTYLLAYVIRWAEEKHIGTIGVHPATSGGPGQLSQKGLEDFYRKFSFLDGRRLIFGSENELAQK